MSTTGRSTTTVTDFWARTERSEFFNARYAGHCPYPDCYKHGDIEQGDGCEYLNGLLMHMRCARAAIREHENT